MISLDSLSAPTARPFHLTLVGEGGMGKTTLAAMMPNPVFILTEDGTTSLIGQNVQSFPLAKNTTDVFDAIKVLATDDHEFKTLVIDSITQLNILIESEIVAADPKAASINQAGGGYGAGQMAVSEVHRKIREWCGALTEAKGMNVVYLAHADTETIDAPDNDPFTRYTLRINKRSVAHYSDNVDLVGMIKLRTFTTGKSDKAKKATTDGTRIITCYPTPSHISKNRFNIEDDLVFDRSVNPFDKPFRDFYEKQQNPKPLKEAS